MGATPTAGSNLILRQDIQKLLSIVWLFRAGLFADKTLVHEWAHLKYGLFDEYTVDEEYPWYTYQRRIYPTRFVHL